MMEGCCFVIYKEVLVCRNHKPAGQNPCELVLFCYCVVSGVLCGGGDCSPVYHTHVSMSPTSANTRVTQHTVGNRPWAAILSTYRH